MMFKKFLGTGALTAALLVGAASLAQAAAILPNAGFNSTTLPPNDDGSTGLVNIGFSLNFFGQNYTQLYVNNNGNVTFTAPLGVFTPFAITGGSTPMLAPFFADVDTRFAGNPTRYGNDTVNGHAAFGVNWIDVDYYFSSGTHTNRDFFQLVIVDRSDIAAGDFDFMFNYNQIQWETGEASGSDAQGCGGTSAHAGWTNGAGSFQELAGSGVNGAFIDSGTCQGSAGPNALILHSLNSNTLGQYVFNVRGGQVVGETPEPGTMLLLGTGLFAAARRIRTRKQS
jgi:hypothetical protein